MQLFHGEALEKISKSMGEYRITRWLEQTCEQDLTEKLLWSKLITFLEKEVKIQQQKMMLQRPKSEDTSREIKEKSERSRYHLNKSFFSGSNSEVPICFICGTRVGESDHVATSGPGGSKVVQYFSCKEFAEKTPAERFSLLKSKGYCFQCLLPGALCSSGKHKEGKCQRDFACSHQSHHRYPSKKHILICDEHKGTAENQDLLQKYKTRCIIKNTELPSFAKDIRLSFHAEIRTETFNEAFCYQTTIKPTFGNKSRQVNDPAKTEKGIFLLQTISLNGEPFNIFYDSGCSDFVVTIDAVNRLGSNAEQEYAGPVMLGGVGDTLTESPHGIYRVRMPLSCGGEAVLSGVCLDQITSPFPVYQLAEAEKDISVTARGIKLPKLPNSVGGKIDLMIGVKYLNLHPKTRLSG